MTSLPEQFSAARLTQLDNGFNLMRSFSDQALDQTSRMIALQISASRAAIEQSTAAARQLLDVRDPRDLLALGSQSQQHLRTMFDYSRELFSIAAGAGFTPLRSYSADALNAITTANAAAAQQTVQAAVASITPSIPDLAPAAAPQAAVAAAVPAPEAPVPAPQAVVAAPQAAPAPVPAPPAVVAAPQAAPAPVPAPEAPVPAPQAPVAQEASSSGPVTERDSLPAAFSVVTSEFEPGSAPTAIAQAASEMADMPVAPPHPVAASVPVEVSVEIELPKVEPVDAAPPVGNPTTTTKVTEIRGTKGRRKN